jgi:hypothetical protein
VCGVGVCAPPTLPLWRLVWSSGARTDGAMMRSRAPTDGEVNGTLGGGDERCPDGGGGETGEMRIFFLFACAFIFLSVGAGPCRGPC